jgi:hypothetical protein
MRYRLHVTVNFRTASRDAVHPELTEEQLMATVQNYIRLPSATSFVMTVAKGYGVSDVRKPIT